MILSTQFILEKYPHVFKNEFNERKILHRAVEDNWGGRVEYTFVCGGYFTGSDWGMYRANELRSLSRTLLLTEDKNGKIELLAFWMDGVNKCYNNINKQSLYIPNFKGYR